MKKKLYAYKPTVGFFISIIENRTKKLKGEAKDDIVYSLTAIVEYSAWLQEELIKRGAEWPDIEFEKFFVEHFFEEPVPPPPKVFEEGSGARPFGGYQPPKAD